jgi:putative hydrolase of the HAD superfamily
MNPETFHGCKAILFDFGGTLDSDGEHWLDRFYALYKDLGFRIPLSEIKRAFYHADGVCSSDSQVVSLGLRRLMKRHVGLQFAALGLADDEKESEMVETFCTESERFLRRNARLLRQLRDRYRLGLVSNFYGNVAALCEEAGLAPALDVILDSALVGMSKPDPGIFRAALERLQLPPQEVTCVGDSFERDMIPARELGMKTIWLKGPHPRIPENPGPVNATISSLSELEVLVS